MSNKVLDLLLIPCYIGYINKTRNSTMTYQVINADQEVVGIFNNENEADELAVRLGDRSILARVVSV